MHENHGSNNMNIPWDKTHSFAPNIWVLIFFVTFSFCSGYLYAAPTGSANPQSVTFNDALQRSVQSKLPFSCPSCDLSGIDFTGRDLTNANLVGANLTKANFSKAILNGAILTRANLTGAILDSVQLNKSNRGAASLAMAILDGTSLKQAQMDGIDLQFAVIQNTDLGSILSTTKIPVKISEKSFISAATNTINCGNANLSALSSRIYVSPDGKDSDSCGTSLTQACQTIAQGISRCSASGCGVLVEWAQYNLTASLQLRNGVNIYGGCLSSGQPQAGLASIINAPSGGQAAVQASQITTPTILQGFKLIGTPASGNNGSPSFTFVVSKSPNLTLLDAEVIAGNGATGNKGGDGLPGAAGGAASQRTAGKVANSSGFNYCNDSSGGDGGAARHVHVDTNFWGNGKCTPSCDGDNACYGYNGSPGSTGSWVSGGNIGEDKCVNCLVTSAGTGAKGNPGNNASCGSNGIASKNQAGSFSGSLWTPSTGGAGNPGGDASGGGGGGSGGYHGVNCFGAIENTGGEGGGGGAGGCGGLGGLGGQQGGGSFAMVIFNSVVSYDRTRVIGGLSGNGAPGGSSGQGGASGQGASGGSRDCTAGTCSGSGGDGNIGGIGGSGGGGAGGNGGPSVGIALVNNSTIKGNVTYYSGTSGQPGPPGKGITTPNNCTSSDGANGIGGLIADTQQF